MYLYLSNTTERTNSRATVKWIQQQTARVQYVFVSVCLKSECVCRCRCGCAECRCPRCVCVCLSVSGCVSALLNYKIRDMENFASGFLTFWIRLDSDWVQCRYRLRICMHSMKIYVMRFLNSGQHTWYSAKNVVYTIYICMIYSYIFFWHVNICVLLSKILIVAAANAELIIWWIDRKS